MRPRRAYKYMVVLRRPRQDNVKERGSARDQCQGVGQQRASRQARGTREERANANGKDEQDALAFITIQGQTSEPHTTHITKLGRPHQPRHYPSTTICLGLVVTHRRDLSLKTTAHAAQ